MILHLLPLHERSRHTPCGKPLPTVKTTPEINEVTCDKCLDLHDAYCQMMYEQEAA